MRDYDVAIVGGGAAGLSAALVLARARRTVAVIDAGEPRNAPATAMHGFLSRDGTPPSALLSAGRDEVVGYGGDLFTGTVTRITPVAEGFNLTRADASTLSARRVLVTTGLRDVLPEVPGIRDRWGRDVLHCPYCHGYEVRDQPLGVLGGTPGAVEHALLVRQWSPDIVHFTNGSVLTEAEQERLDARGIALETGVVTGLAVGESLDGVEVDGRVVARRAIFVRPMFVPNAELLTELGCTTDEQGWVVADRNGRTSITGVWVAGNAVNPRAQVITAAGEGSAAAIDINNDLVADDVDAALRARLDSPVT